MQQKNRNYAFTINNPRETCTPKLTSQVKYIKWQLEKCPTTGTPHFQGVIIFKCPVRYKTVAKHLPRAQFEACRDLYASINYVGKDETRIDGPWELGEGPKKQGQRTDLEALTSQITQGEITAESVALDQPVMYHQYGRTLHKVEDIALRRKFRTEMTEGIWLYGPTGTGKSHAAFEGFDPTTHYLWKNDNGWQDGYTGQETVIINDFRGSIPYDELLQMVDKWPYTVPRRCREPAPFLAKKVIITSSLPPDQVYNRREANDSIEQLRRRFKIIHHTNLGGQCSIITH